MTAPAYVAPGELFTYTLIIQNMLGYPLHQLIITDAVPAGASFAYILDGGSHQNGVVTWDAATLEVGDRMEVRFAVAAPPVTHTLLVNDHYSVFAQDWITPTYGDPVYTTVGEYTPIPLIQGIGFRSPWVGEAVIVRGGVTGFFQGNYPDGKYYNGFFIQDLNGDGASGASDALFVNSAAGNIAVNSGDLVEVTGIVQEFDEYGGGNLPGEACLRLKWQSLAAPGCVSWGRA